MQPELIKQAFDAVIAVACDAVDIANEACLAARQAASAQSPMIKVATERCVKVAHIVANTGVVDASPDDLAHIFSEGDPGRLMDVLEKLASRAMFPMFIEDSGCLVDKPTSDDSLADDAGGSSNARWRKAFAETKRELAAGKR